ncbi:MAG: hypothetical protein E7G36_00425 [Peptoniphilus rhinitidis]|uniref:hypothetical protein n=1 Tax=Peptoniphilus rhinitidis TaxID=1175452 RepID=UPI0028FEC1C8|nr:hypothetical protein [Peptoniphilus rhinitidis]MDU2108980.1 hypothetical protein [Peptoniphilus lacydonensis]MDU3750169.1 hypothetical protein [Peptoniphilus rhinitidis]
MLIKECLKNFEKTLDVWNESKDAVRVYLDVETGELMSFQYDNLNSWEVFNTDSVKEICSRNSLTLIDKPFEYVFDDLEFLEAINYSLKLKDTDDRIIQKYVRINKNIKEEDVEKLETLFLFEGGESND